MKKILNFVATVMLGLTAITMPASIADPTSEYARFFAIHDRLHPPEGKREPIKVLVRKTFWNDHDRVLLVDAHTTQGKGALMIVEGLAGSDWLSAFRISTGEGAVFDLTVPNGESVPCKVLVKSGRASAITPVQNAPPACNAAVNASQAISRI